MKRVIDISKLTMNAVLFHGELFDEYKRDAERAIKESTSLESEILKALEDVRAEITGNLETIIGKYDSNTKPEDMPSRKIERNNGRTEAIDIINRKIKEIKNECT